MAATDMRSRYNQLLDRARSEILQAHWPISYTEGEEIAARISEGESCDLRAAQMALTDALSELAREGVGECPGCREMVWWAKDERGWLTPMNPEAVGLEGLVDGKPLFYLEHSDVGAEGRGGAWYVRLANIEKDPGPFLVPHRATCGNRSARLHLLPTGAN